MGNTPPAIAAAPREASRHGPQPSGTKANLISTNNNRCPRKTTSGTRQAYLKTPAGKGHQGLPNILCKDPVVGISLRCQLSHVLSSVRGLNIYKQAPLLIGTLRNAYAHARAFRRNLRMPRPSGSASVRREKVSFRINVTSQCLVGVSV